MLVSVPNNFHFLEVILVESLMDGFG
jgi:hypothetical protein